MLGEATTQFRAALALARQLHGEQSVVTQESAGELGGALATSSQFAEAEPLLRQSVAWQKKHPSEPKFRMEQPMMLAHLLEETHRLQEAERHLAEAQAIAISAFGRDSIQYVRVCNVLGNTKRSEGDFPGALAAYQTAIEISNRVSPNNAQVIPPELNVCIMLFALG